MFLILNLLEFKLFLKKILLLHGPLYLAKLILLLEGVELLIEGVQLLLLIFEILFNRHLLILQTVNVEISRELTLDLNNLGVEISSLLILITNLLLN